MNNLCITCLTRIKICATRKWKEKIIKFKEQSPLQFMNLTGINGILCQLLPTVEELQLDQYGIKMILKIIDDEISYVIM